MPTLPDFSQFAGRYWDTAAIRSALDYQGSTAPHTGAAYSEAMLLGLSGGITFGYFTFHYRGYDPQVNLLTRNSFAPMERIFERMKIPRELRQSTSADRGRKHLLHALEAGYAPIASPDMWSLPYNALREDPGMWGGMPLVIFGYEPERGEAYIADRSHVPLTVPSEALDKARSRIKKDRQRLILLGAPAGERLPDAIRQGIADCIALMTEKPPKGSVKNFGLRALQHWADMLAKSTKGSWAREYASGRTLLAALSSAYTFMGPAFGKTRQAERDVYADFLDEAADALGEDRWRECAAAYRVAGAAWQDLHQRLLPADLPILGETAQLIDRRVQLFKESGTEKLADILACRERLAALKSAAERDFPLDERELRALRAGLHEAVLRVLAAETRAVHALQAASA